MPVDLVEEFKKESLAELQKEQEDIAKAEVKNIIRGIICQQGIVKQANDKIKELQEKLKAVSVTNITI